MSVNLKSQSRARFASWAGVASALLSIAIAPVAVADPGLPAAGSGPASDIIGELKADGYVVSVNFLQGNPNVPLNECRVSNINDPSGPATPVALSTVYVDVLCPNAK